MKAIHIIAIIAISFIAGMFGGAFSERVFANPKDEAKIHDEIVAHGFFLVDENKKPRAGMSFDNSGNPTIFVMDREENARIKIGNAPGGSILTLSGKDAGMNVALKADDDGNSGIAIMKTSGQPRMMMQYEPGRGPAFVLYDDNSTGKAVFMVDHGKPSITLLQGDKKPAVSLLADPLKGAMLAAWNSQGQHRLSLGLMHDKPLLFAYNPDDTGLLFNTQRDGRPALGLLSDGRVVWSATGTAPQMPAMDGILDQILR